MKFFSALVTVVLCMGSWSAMADMDSKTSLRGTQGPGIPVGEFDYFGDGRSLQKASIRKRQRGQALTALQLRKALQGLGGRPRPNSVKRTITNGQPVRRARLPQKNP